MLRISSAQYDASVLQTNSHALATTGVQSKEATSASTSSNQQGVTLSGRALGVQKLSQEFFSNGTKGFQITSDFVAKLEEYGLINSTEASRLSPLISPMSRFKEQGNNSALDKVTQFIQDFRDELKKDKPDSKLIDTLDRAEKIIENFDGVQSTASQTNIKSVLAELNSFYNSADAESIDAEDKDALIQLGLTLRIADRLSPTAISSSKVNSYLSTMSRFY
ncbi:hypothetical protein SAMN02745127_00565 [Oceanospirillum multiglobuliferum]|uniref:Uncharacterized protein n=2 Tax=Oceanospirillum TaxID=965 RepID=A0A1T4LWV3_9GAMM|nr:hypothetical protein [Oceanospirillum multiglobuliferum]OPX56329.1 hypothetical protein BTE48_04995 [Oceanospirillum multiglobuliferum]SJZ59230.1 hypothetical protein SAMN02745127_00565 [Oceanospirillum multiglobuliferum]